MANPFGERIVTRTYLHLVRCNNSSFATNTTYSSSTDSATRIDAASDHHRSVNVRRRHASISFFRTETNHLKHESFLPKPNPQQSLYRDRLPSIIYISPSFIPTTYGVRLPLITATAPRQSSALASHSFQHRKANASFGSPAQKRTAIASNTSSIIHPTVT